MAQTPTRCRRRMKLQADDVRSCGKAEHKKAGTWIERHSGDGKQTECDSG
jgi:hypothetical protein